MSSEIKLSLYADDVILFLQNPIQSLEFVNKILDSYSLSSGYIVNQKKSMIKGLNVDEGSHFSRMEAEGC